MGEGVRTILSGDDNMTNQCVSIISVVCVCMCVCVCINLSLVQNLYVDPFFSGET